MRLHNGECFKMKTSTKKVRKFFPVLSIKIDIVEEHASKILSCKRKGNLIV